MNYKFFIEAIKQHETPRVIGISFNTACSTQRLPTAIAIILPDLIGILNKNINSFCEDNQLLAVFGLQFGPAMLESETPFQLNRVFSSENPNSHFCLILQVLAVNPEKLNAIKDWQGSQNIMIDFTTGIVMDCDNYFSLLEGEKNQGVIYGSINEKKLSQMWSALHTEYVDASQQSCNSRVFNSI